MNKSKDNLKKDIDNLSKYIQEVGNSGGQLSEETMNNLNAIDKLLKDWGKEIEESHIGEKK